MSIAAHSRHHMIVSPEIPEVVWGLRWAGRRLTPIPSLYPAFERVVRGCRVAHIHRSPDYADVVGSWTRGLPWIFTLHGIGFEEYWTHRPDMVRGIREYNRAVLQTMERAPRATVNARWLRDYVAERTSASPTVIPPGIDLGEFRSSGAAEFLQYSGLPAGYVLWVGRLALEKGMDSFVRLAARIPERVFVMVSNRPVTEAQSESSETWPRNFHYFGPIPRALVVSAFHGCSVHVSTSLYEAASTTLPEAMACGKPVVGPDILGPREIIHDSGGGLAYDPASFDDLVAKVRTAIDRPEMGRRGEAFVREQRDWSKLTEIYDRMYEDLAGAA